MRWRRYGAVDVHYPPPDGARAALVVADDPRFAHIVAEHTAWLDHAEPYRAGRFFERELPAIRAVLAETDDVDLLIVDGYVHLDATGRPGLGAHLHALLDRPVIGVAKTVYRGATHAVPVTRSGAARPLYVTAVGLAVDRAAAFVQDMAGPHRIPDGLRRADALARRNG
jgi:deoxyribonuclease V